MNKGFKGGVGMSNFEFFVEADICKSEDGKEERRIMEGYASTETEDRQGESLVQKGLDITDFVNHGFFNYDHDNSIILGYPVDGCRVDDNGFYVRGELLKGIPEADRMWSLAVALKKSKAPRKVGFSIEGKVLERQGSRIVKAKIYNVAVTTNPVNTTCTWEAVVKSFNGNSTVIDRIDKALEAGYEVNPTDMEGGSVFRKEDLDSSLHNLSYVIDNKENKKILKEKLSKKALTNAELIVYLQLTKGWSQDQCREFLKRLS